MSVPILAVEDLAVRFATPQGPVAAVTGASFTLARGETLAIVGESGSGKSVTSLALMGLLPRPGATITGRAILDGRGGAADLVTLDAAGLRARRGRDIAMVFQEPMTSLNPVRTVGSLLIEAIRLHRPMERRAAGDEACRLLDLVGIPAPRQRLGAYPHQLSGGMRQRVMIALALSGEPSVLIADEPTTALDVTIQAQILALLRRLQDDTGMAILFITHNLGVVAEIADRVMVMYAGQVVEEAPVHPLFRQPLMPYTAGLLASVPRLDAAGRRTGPLDAIPGNVPDPRLPPPGCVFNPRCAARLPGRCEREVPALESAGPERRARCLRWRDLGLGLPS